MDIPGRFRAVCEFCRNPDNPIDTRMEGSMQFTSGWCMVRNDGGAHGISLAKRDPTRWAHRQCVERETKGLTGQSRMFA